MIYDSQQTKLKTVLDFLLKQCIIIISSNKSQHYSTTIQEKTQQQQQHQPQRSTTKKKHIHKQTNRQIGDMATKQTLILDFTLSFFSIVKVHSIKSKTQKHNSESITCIWWPYSVTLSSKTDLMRYILMLSDWRCELQRKPQYIVSTGAMLHYRTPSVGQVSAQGQMWITLTSNLNM